MSRKKHRIDRQTPPDTIYGSALISKMINNLMVDGKKSVAAKVFYQASEKFIAEHKETLQKYDNSFAVFFDKAIVSPLKPRYALSSKRVGGSTYQIPSEIDTYSAISVALKVIAGVVKSGSGRPASETLYREFLNILKEEGECIKKRNDFNKRVESSKVFANFG